MNKEIPNEWYTPSYQDRPPRPHEAGAYKAPPRPGSHAETWWPELLQAFLDRQHIGFESAHEFARSAARSYVRMQLGETVDPDQLLITTLYITEDFYPPKRASIAHSMTLTDALMRNWQQNGNGQFLEHLSQLRPYREGGYPVRITGEPIELYQCFAYEAIYRKTEPQVFDATTHTVIDPKDFKRFVWEADLQSRYESSLKDFWQAHGADYHLLVEAALLKSAYVQYEEGSLTLEDKSLVLKSLGLDTRQAWETLTLAAFRDAPMTHTITFRELVLYRYASTDIIVIQHENTGRLLVYIPGNSSPIHAFSNMSSLRGWVAQQCKDVRRRKSLEAHFRAEDDPDGLFLSGLQTTLAGLAAYPHMLDSATQYWRPETEITLGPAITPWPFSHFKKSLQARLASDGLQLIRSRADYNKEVAALVLSNAIVAVGAVAMVVPYLWAPLAAMSLALVGLGADEMVNGRTEQEKEQGAGRIVFGLLNAVPAGFEGGAAASRILGAASRVGDELVPGAADEVGQMIQARSDKEKAQALAHLKENNAQRAAEAQEQADESLGEQRVRRNQEENHRQLAKAHREASYDSAVAFGVEPQGLRSLSPALRAELAGFESQVPLAQGGSWKIDKFGAVYTVKNRETNTTRYFARVHSGIYPVERVDEVNQYRIFSVNDPSLKGPYIKRTTGYYSDIDLRSGLRGGDSYIEVEPQVVPMPEMGKPEVAIPKPQPQLMTHIAMDGIELRKAGDGWGNLVDRHFADGTPVSYDADSGCWRVNIKDVMWFNDKGVWKRGSLKAFNAARSRLTSPVKWELYKFPRLPGYARDQEAVDKIVHQIWLGSNPPRAGLINTIKTNVRRHPELNFVLHVDLDNAEVSGHLKRLREAFEDHPNMKISALDQESFFAQFVREEHTAVPFRYFREGAGQNLAAASDVLRYRLIREYGGIYMDCDDVIQGSFSGATLNAGPSDVLMGGPVTSKGMRFFGPGNSHFASRPGNTVLMEAERELYTRFMAERGALDELSRQGSALVDGVNPYMSKIFDVTGPRLLLDTLKRARPDYAGLLDGEIRPTPGIKSEGYEDLFHQATEFYAPFGSRLKITAGAENSWKKSLSIDPAVELTGRV